MTHEKKYVLITLKMTEDTVVLLRRHMHMQVWTFVSVLKQTMVIANKFSGHTSQYNNNLQTEVW